MQKLEWRTEKRKVGDLQLYGKNPRKMTTKQKRNLLESLEQFGLVEIPVVDTDNTVVAGNQRVTTLVLNGDAEQEIDVRVPNRKLTENEFQTYNLKSNAIDGEFDIPMLIRNFDPVIVEDAGIDAGMKALERESTKGFRIPEMELKSFESYDYLVFVFKDVRDMVFMCDKLNVTKVNGSFVPNNRKVGLGRVLDGKVLVERFSDINSKPGEIPEHNHT